MLKVYYLNKPLSYMLSLILGELVHLILHRTMLKLRPHVSSEVNWAFGQQQMNSLSHTTKPSGKCQKMFKLALELEAN